MEGGGLLVVNGGVADIGVHGSGMVAPDGQLLDVSGAFACLECELGEGSVVVKSGHGSEVLTGNAWGVMGENEGIGVGGVAYDDALAGALGIVVHGLTSVDKDLTVVLDEV